MFSMTRNRIVRLAAMMLLLPAAACEELATALTDPTTTAPTNTSSGSATVTFWTTDSSPSSIAVFVDGEQVGVLSAYRTTAPTCGASTTGGTITVSVSPGTHTMSAHEVSASGRWGPASFNVSSGGCLTYVLNP